jgi:peptidoglycan hydrolase-like protein with peptidoglycan-binding domain
MAKKKSGKKSTGKRGKRRSGKTNWPVAIGTAVGYGVVAGLVVPAVVPPGTARDVGTAGVGIVGGIIARRNRKYRDVGNGLIAGGAGTGAYNWWRSGRPAAPTALGPGQTATTLPSRAGTSRVSPSAAITRAQRQLSALNIYSGPIDGTARVGGPTQLAIQRFQTREGLPATGTLDAATVARLEAAVPNPGGPAAPGGASVPTTCEQMRQAVYAHSISTGVSPNSAAAFAGTITNFCNARGSVRAYVQASTPGDLRAVVGAPMAAALLTSVGRTADAATLA